MISIGIFEKRLIANGENRLFKLSRITDFKRKNRDLSYDKIFKTSGQVKR